MLLVFRCFCFGFQLSSWNKVTLVTTGMCMLFLFMKILKRQVWESNFLLDNYVLEIGDSKFLKGWGTLRLFILNCLIFEVWTNCFECPVKLGLLKVMYLLCNVCLLLLRNHLAAFTFIILYVLVLLAERSNFIMSLRLPFALLLYTYQLYTWYM